MHHARSRLPARLRLLLVLLASGCAPAARPAAQAGTGADGAIPVRVAAEVGAASPEEARAAFERPHPAAEPDGVRFVRSEPGPDGKIVDEARTVRSCRELADARRDGFVSDAQSMVEMKAANAFATACRMLEIVSRAAPSKRSFVAEFRLDASAPARLPPCYPFGTEEADEEARANAAAGKSWREAVPSLVVEKTSADGLVVLEPGVARFALETRARGDFDGDGTEDLLLHVGYRADGGSMGGSWHQILTRDTRDAVLRVLSDGGICGEE